MSARWANWTGIAAVLLLGVTPTHAGEAVEGARRALDAHRSGDGGTLQRVARSEHGDVWQVCERLFGAEGGAVAEALAAEAQEERLSAYVAWRRAHPLPEGTWEALDRVEQLRAQRDVDGARAALKRASLPERGVAGVLHLTQRIFLLPQPDDALAAGDRAAKEAASIGWTAGHQRVLQTCVELAHRAKRHDRTLAFGTALLELTEPSGDRRARHLAHSRVARAQRALGRPPEALRHARIAVELASAPTERRDALRYLIILDIANPAKHELRELLLELRRLETALNNPRGIAATDVQLGTAEAYLGRWASAVSRMESALAYFEKHGNAWERRGANLNAALVALEMFDARRAHQHLASAREASKGLKIDDTPLYVLEAAAFGQQRDHAGAEKAYNVVLSRGERVNPRTRAGAWISLAIIQIRKDRLEESERSLLAARENLEKTGAGDLRAHLLATESLRHIALGELETAVQLAEEAHRIADKLMLHGLSILIEARLAEGLFRKGEWTRARVHGDRAVDLVLRRSAVLPERLGAHYRAELPNMFALAIEIPLRAGDLARLFTNAERVRSVSLRNRLGGPRAALDVLEPELQEEERQLQLAETKGVRRCRVALGTTQADEIEEAFTQLREVRERLDRHRERMHLRHATAAQLIDPKADSLEVTQERLAPTEAHIHFAQGMPGVVAVVVSRDSVRQVPMGTPQSLQELLDTLTLEDPTSPWKQAWAKLERRILEPLAVPETVTRLTVVPTGQLELVPFAALWPSKEVTLLPSATIGRLLETRDASAGRGVLAIGDPEGSRGPRLPAAAREAERVGDVRLLGDEASEAGLRAALAGRDRWHAVHFACHALIDPEHPLRTSLALAADGQDDGFWTVSEILHAQVPADIVVLAACSSAQGRTFAQEGRVGFVHAFFVAGARHVVASLWDIDDRAAEAFMGHFYAELSEGVAPVTALRRTQTWMRRQAAWRHPAHWAGWQLWGPHDE